jgi:hypothetical protein
VYHCAKCEKKLAAIAAKAAPRKRGRPRRNPLPEPPPEHSHARHAETNALTGYQTYAGSGMNRYMPGYTPGMNVPHLNTHPIQIPSAPPTVGHLNANPLQSSALLGQSPLSPQISQPPQASQLSSSVLASKPPEKSDSEPPAKKVKAE